MHIDMLKVQNHGYRHGLLGAGLWVCSPFNEGFASFTPPSTTMSDAISGQSPWNIYADELSHKHGYPLWMPDPDPTLGEVQLGDVGWLHEGGFYQMFNSMKAKGEPQVRNAVPTRFEPFCPPVGGIVGPRDTCFPPVVRGRSVNQGDNVDVSTTRYVPRSSSLAITTE